MRGFGCVVAIGFSACGSVEGKKPDANVASDVAVAIDAPPPPCNLNSPFETPVLVPGVNSASTDTDAWYTADRLSVYFRSARTGGPGLEDLFSASRTSPTAAFGTPTAVPGINSTGYENGVVTTSDALTLYLGSTRDGTGHDIYVTTRPSLGAAFSTPALVLNVNQGTSNTIPSHLNASGTTLYMASDRGGDTDIYRATGANGVFGAATAIAELNSTAYDYSPVLTGDELTVYFQSARTAGSVGRTDIWVAKRSTTSDGFGTPTNVTELNSVLEEAPTWVSPDGCQIVIGSNRTGSTSSSHDIWFASRPL